MFQGAPHQCCDLVIYPNILLKLLALFARKGLIRAIIYRQTHLSGDKLSEPLDTIDAKILDLIQQDASLSVADIAERVGLSSSPCWRRIKRMEEAGIIQGRVTLLDRQTLGLGFEVIANVKLALPSKENLEAFEQLVRKWPEVMECMTVTGAVDYIIRVTTTDMYAYDKFLRDKLLGSALVSDVQSRIIINVSKRTTAVPLGLVSDYVPAS
jgi:DNA-binding Lrp family transcriptional regulator